MIRPQDWQPVDGLELEPNAVRAVTAFDHNVVVAAGPGAGKTELLAQRADFLLRTGASRYPRRILAISFKVDAARNLRDRVRVRSGGQYAARFDSLTFHAFAKRLIDSYRPLLSGEDALDPDYTLDHHDRIPRKQITFDDLVPLALDILAESRYARGALRQTYSHVFLDEFQDATKNQYRLVKSAFQDTGAVLTAVGDVKQRIMAWAGALDGIMKTFADDFDAAPLPLYQNFRSAPRLRRMQNRMIADMDPDAAIPEKDLEGSEGTIRVLHFDTQVEEAETVAEVVQRWLAAGVPPSEIAILVRQQSKLVTEALSEELHDCGIAYRNEQSSQDLAAEPVAALIFNFVWVVAGDRRPDAYADLMRLASPSGVNEEAALQFDSRLQRLLEESRAAVRALSFIRGDADAWRGLIAILLNLVSRATLHALSPAYQQGARLDEVIEQAFAAFSAQLALDKEPVQAMKRLSELDAVRILTIHKSKGLEFEKVVVLGVERQFFRGAEARSEYFVAISRAKNELVLTYTEFRAFPSSPVDYWTEHRTAHREFLDYASETSGQESCAEAEL